MASSAEQVRSPYYERLSGDVKERYNEKMRKCGGIDPYTLKQNKLSSTSNDFPKITIYDIINYMIHSVSSYTKKSFENYKGTEAYKFFESGFVLNIGSKIYNKSAIVTGKVMHSQRLNDSASHAWILAELDGKVICGHCTCIAGLSETCSHVGAICFAIHKISESKETKSVTDILCKWNVPSFKEVSMSAAKDIDWRVPNRERSSYETSFIEYCDSIRHLSDQRIDQFLYECHSNGDDAALRSIIFPSEKKRLTNLKDETFLSNLYNEDFRDKSLLELIDIGKSNSTSLNLSESDVREIFRITLPRLKSKCYLGLLRGRITGSTFKSCCVTNFEDPSIVTIKRVICPMKETGLIPSLRYQVQNKNKAIQRYISWADLQHEDFVYSECGLIINPNLPYFVGSPDGLLYCSCHGDGILEVKCLNIPEIDTLDDYLTRKPNNMFNKCGDQYAVERSHELFYRIQLQINLNCSKYCDCVIWTPQKSIVVKVFADTSFWSTEMGNALKFHEHVIMPELLGKFYTQKRESTEASDEENFEPAGYELLSLEIELLESEEYQDIKSASTSSETILFPDLSTVQPESELKSCQQSKSLSLLGLSLEEPLRKDHDHHSVHSEKLVNHTKVNDLKSLTLEEICSTFDYHQKYLADVYGKLIKETKIHYRPSDLPSFAAFDLVTEKQFEAMVRVAESKLVTNVEQHNSSDVIFDAIIAEWAYQVFGISYNFNRQQAVQAVKKMTLSDQ